MTAWFKDFIDVIFASGLFVNALLFVPQAIRIFKNKAANDLSLTTFVGFWLTQLSAVVYGYLNSDYILMIGYILALITCGMATFLMIVYRIKRSSNKINTKNIQ